MARVRELIWKCADCGTQDILGRHKQCPSCGSPREKGEMKSMAASSGKGAVVTDPELLKLANSRPDWFCTHCGTGNQGTTDRCRNCASPRYGTKEENHPNPMFASEHIGRRARTPEEEALKEREREEKERKKEQDREEAARRLEEARHLRDLEQERAREGRERIREQARKLSSPAASIQEEYQKVRAEASVLPFVLGGIAVVGVLAAIVGAIWWGTQEHVVAGKVDSMSWNRIVSISSWTQTRARLWGHQTSEVSEIPPVNGGGERAGRIMIPGSCKEEHFSDETYVSGTHQECRDVTRPKSEDYTCTKSEDYICGETCKDNGNGFETCEDDHCTRDVASTCTRTVQVFDHKECEDVKEYSQRPIMKKKCDYATQEWVVVRTPSLSGQGVENIRWPEFDLGPLERKSFSEKYEVGASYSEGGEKETFSRTLSLDEYMSWNVNQDVYVKVTNLGVLKGFYHEKPPKE